MLPSKLVLYPAACLGELYHTHLSHLFCFARLVYLLNLTPSASLKDTLLPFLVTEKGLPVS